MLQQLLTPNLQLTTTLVQMPLEQLLCLQIRALVLDVDLTLLPRHQSVLPPAAEQWLRHAKQKLPIHLLSNNPSRRRIRAVAEPLNLPYTVAAAKPRRRALRRVLNELNVPNRHVALAGDRLFTDVLVGNRMGLFTVLVKPINTQGEPCQRDHIQRLEVGLARWVGTQLS